MKKLAISLCVLGFVTVNAGTVSSSHKGSGGKGRFGAVTAQDHIEQEASGLVRSGHPWSGDQHQQRDCLGDKRDDWWKQDWEEDCEDWDDDRCNFSVHSARAGDHASGDTHTEAVMASQGVLVIPEQHYVTDCECTEVSDSS